MGAQWRQRTEVTASHLHLTCLLSPVCLGPDVSVVQSTVITFCLNYKTFINWREVLIPAWDTCWQPRLGLLVKIEVFWYDKATVVRVLTDSCTIIFRLQSYRLSTGLYSLSSVLLYGNGILLCLEYIQLTYLNELLGSDNVWYRLTLIIIKTKCGQKQTFSCPETVLFWTW